MKAVLFQLDALAKRINEREKTIDILKKDAIGKVNETITEALLQGQDLNDAKAKVGHGEWATWLSTHCPKVCDRTAQRYMKLANTTHVSDLTKASGLRQAYIACGIIPEDEAKDTISTTPSIRLPKFSNVLERKPIDQWSEIERSTFKEWFNTQAKPIYEQLEGQTV